MFPVFCIIVSVLCCNFMGDSLRSAADCFE